MTNDNKTHKTSSTADFFAKYKDPRWQKKRLEVMQQASFRCESCESDTKTLNVHHKSYKKNRNPWEYEEHELECLCEDCHNVKHEVKSRLDTVLHDFKTLNWSSKKPEDELLGFLEGRLADTFLNTRTYVISHEYLQGYCFAHLLDADEINTDRRLYNIIEVADGWLEYEMFEWAFKSLPVDEQYAQYAQEKIETNKYAHYPAWIMSKITQYINEAFAHYNNYY